MSVRGKFRVAHVTDYGNNFKEVQLTAVWDDGIPENARYSKATPTGTVTTIGGVKGMEGRVGVARAPWRVATNAIGPLSDITYLNVTGDPGTPLAPAMDTTGAVTGQDGWVFYGSRWNDQSGELHVVRYARNNVRGTFTVEVDTVTLTGSGTFWTQDLRPGDEVFCPELSTTIVIDTVVSDTEATSVNPLTPGSGNTATLEQACLDYYDVESQ